MDSYAFISTKFINMKQISIYGAGGFGREVNMLIEQINMHSLKWSFIGYWDDGVEKGTNINDYNVLGGINELNNYSEELYIAIAVGDPKTKERIINKIKNPKIHFPTLVHPSVQIGNKFVSIGIGSIICGGSIITTNIKIGDHVILNLSCTVGHDTIIGDYSSFMPSVNISGEVNIEKCVYVGTGAKIINQLSIGEYSIVGAGAVVSKSLPAKCTAVGIPAKPIKFRK